MIDEQLYSISENCTNCNLCVKECRFLQRYGTPKKIAQRLKEVKTNPRNHRMAFEIIADGIPLPKPAIKRTVTLHDPCPTRSESSIHHVIRLILQKQGLTINEMPHSGKTTLCCGEGGAVHYIDPELSRQWTLKRKQEVGGRHLLTYCSGCAQFLNPSIPTHHILDLIFEPRKTLAGKIKPARSPWTWLNRYRLKRQLKKLIPAAVHRERDLSNTSDS